MSPILIKGGTIVGPEAAIAGDVLLEGETIARVAPNIHTGDALVVDARGLIVLPGLIDPHVHLRDPGATHKEDFASGTRAALAGGITTVLVMPNDVPPTTTSKTLNRKRSTARRKAVADYGFFLGATQDNVEEISRVEGIVGLKIFLGSSTGDLLVPDMRSLLRHFEAFPRDKVIAIHAEDEEALDYFRQTQAQEGAPHSRSRPPLCAALAVSRALALARHAQQRLHICHVSTAWELALIREARRQGVQVTCEVTPHHLFLSQEDESRLGPAGKMNPPLRAPRDVEALWKSLDRIDAIASDHAPHTWEEKLGADGLSGVPGLEITLPMLMTAVAQSRLQLTDVARLTAYNPARIFGLKGKGGISEGHSADLTLVDPNAERVLAPPFTTRCNWSPFSGTRVRGQVERVFLRGREVFAEGRILVEGGFGHEVTVGSAPPESSPAP